MPGIEPHSGNTEIRQLLSPHGQQEGGLVNCHLRAMWEELGLRPR